MEMGHEFHMIDEDHNENLGKGYTYLHALNIDTKIALRSFFIGDLYTFDMTLILILGLVSDSSCCATTERKERPAIFSFSFIRLLPIIFKKLRQRGEGAKRHPGGTADTKPKSPL